MMSELKVMLSLTMRNLYGKNVFRYTKDKKAKNRYKLLTGIFIWLGVLVCAYVGGMVYGLIYLKAAECVPSYLVVLASLLVFVFNLFKAGSVLFSKRGYEMISSLPVRTVNIVISRFLSMYVESLIVTAVLMVPGIVVYGVLKTPHMLFYLVMAIALIFVPIIPLTLVTVVGSIITAIASRMKHKNMVQTILSLIFILAVLFLFFGMETGVENLSMEALAELAGSIKQMIQKLYYPAIWVQNAALYGKVGEGILFAAVSLVAVTVLLWLITLNFHRISQRMMVTYSRHNYQMKALKRQSRLKALYVREIKRYFASSIYVTNTIVGPVLSVAMAVVILIGGIDKIQSMLNIPLDIKGFIPFVCAMPCCMMPPVSCAISMEGKNIWIAKTLPIRSKELWDSKILVSLTLIFPAYVITEILLMIALKPTFMELLWLVLIPLVMMLFVVVFGITVNLKFYSFNWEKEEYVVKQSFSSFLGGFAGVFLAIICFGILFVVPVQFGNPAKGILCAVIFAVTVILYRKNNRIELYLLDENL